MFSIQLSSIVKKEIVIALLKNKDAIINGVTHINIEDQKPKFDLIFHTSKIDNSLMPIPITLKEIPLEDEELKTFLSNGFNIQNIRLK